MKNASDDRTGKDGLMTHFGSMNLKRNEAIQHFGMQGTIKRLHQMTVVCNQHSSG